MSVLTIIWHIHNLPEHSYSTTIPYFIYTSWVVSKLGNTPTRFRLVIPATSYQTRMSARFPALVFICWSLLIPDIVPIWIIHALRDMLVPNYLPITWMWLLTGSTWLIPHLLFWSVHLVSMPVLTPDAAVCSYIP